jgi:hypothetical protein
LQGPQKTSNEKGGTTKQRKGLKRPPMKKKAPLKIQGTQKTSDEKMTPVKVKGAKKRPSFGRKWASFQKTFI